MAFDWFSNLAEANSYFSNERLISTSWDALTDAQKTKVIVNAYNWIYYSKRFNVPKLADATAEQLVILKKAQGECCYFLAMHLDDMDRRKGIQAQGVTHAGIVKETYDIDSLQELSFPPIVIDMLSDFDLQVGLSVLEIDRDEDETVDTDVVT